MFKIFKSHIFSTGLAMFSMFFGAGNVVFPLALGQYAQDCNFYAIFGLLITAVLVPFLGLFAMTLYYGDYHRFFGTMGRLPGFVIALAIMGLIGPFGALPRTIALSYSTTKMFLPELSVVLFSILSCLLIFLCTVKKNRIVEIIGTILTPFLLISLSIIIIKGIYTAPAMLNACLPPLEVFWKGFMEGYQTMDLLGAFFFSSVVIASLRHVASDDHDRSFKHLLVLTIKASCIGASLLALIYIGFSYVAAYHSLILQNVPAGEILGQIAHLILGPYAGIIASLAVALACLTTAIALSAVFSVFLHQDIFKKKVSYLNCLIMTLVVTFFVSTLEFDGIFRFLVPILQVSYPALIVLTLMNIGQKVWGWKGTQIAVFATFLLSLTYTVLTNVYPELF